MGIFADRAEELVRAAGLIPGDDFHDEHVAGLHKCMVPSEASEELHRFDIALSKVVSWVVGREREVRAKGSTPLAGFDKWRRRMTSIGCAKFAAGEGFNDETRDRLFLRAVERLKPAATRPAEGYKPEGGPMGSQEYSEGFIDNNNGRHLYVRLHAGNRVGIFDGQGNFVMDINPRTCDILHRHAKAVCRDVADGTYEEKVRSAGRPMLDEGATADGSMGLFPGMILSPDSVQALSERGLRTACAIEGVAVHGDDILVTRSRLETHFRHKRGWVTDDVKQALDHLSIVNKQLSEQNSVLAAKAEDMQSLAKKSVDDKVALVRERLDLQVALHETNVAQSHLRLEVDRVRLKNDNLAKELERDTNTMSTDNQNDTNEMHQQINADDLASARAFIARADAAELAAKAVATPDPPTVGSMFTDAVQLATVQQSSKLAVSKVSPLLIKAGAPESFIYDARFQGALGLILPFLIANYSHMVPGLKKMDTVRTLSQQQLIIGLAEIIGVSVMDVLSIVMDIVKSLNEGADATVEQLPGE